MSPIQQQNDDGPYVISCDGCGRGEQVGDVDKAEFPAGEHATRKAAVRAAKDAGFDVGDDESGIARALPARCAECVAAASGEDGS